MKKEIVSFEVAKRLKNIGYNETCEMFYVPSEKAPDQPMLFWTMVDDDNYRIKKVEADEKFRGVYLVDLLERPNSTPDYVAAPTLDEVRNWLEEKFEFMIDTTYDRKDNNFDYHVTHKEKHSAAGGYDNKTRTEALTKAISSVLYFIESDHKKQNHGV